VSADFSIFAELLPLRGIDTRDGSEPLHLAPSSQALATIDLDYKAMLIEMG
jgi:hypothetical protein